MADIGLKPELVERRLKTFFKLAATWDAILLIDEADILLEFRNHERAGLDKNAMVSGETRPTLSLVECPS